MQGAVLCHPQSGEGGDRTEKERRNRETLTLVFPGSASLLGQEPFVTLMVALQSHSL